MNEPALVELRNVSKRYPGVVALDDVTSDAEGGNRDRACGRERRREVDAH